MFSARRADDADLIRARLRALLDDGRSARGWLPDDPLDDPPGEEDAADDQDEDEWDLRPSPARRHLAVVPDPPDDDARVTVRLGQRVPGGPGLPAPRAGARRPDGRLGGPSPRRPGDPGRGDGPRSDPDDQDPDLDLDLDDPLAGAAGRHRASGAELRVTPGRTSARALWVAALVAAVAVAGWSWLSRPGVDPVTAVGSPSVSAPPPTSGAPEPAAVVVVSVVGQVAAPGLVTLPVGSRVADAVAAAGGLLPEADPAGYNAAALLSDGQQVAIGVPGAAAPAAGTGSSGGLVDLNTATTADLDELPGLGPVLAQRIVDHRTASGPFTSVEQLDDVSGIGPALYGQLSPLVTVFPA